MHQHYEAVQRMQNYIAQHLNETITPAQLSEVSMFSPWYSAKLFRQLTGLYPADYIRKLKLSESALRLRDGNCTVTDVAFDCGFGSVEGYQRAFFKEFGCNPGEYAGNPVALYLFTPYDVKYRELKKEINGMENLNNVFVQMIEKPERKVIIKRGKKADNYWDYCMEVGCDVWGLLTSMKSLSGEPVCLWLPLKYRKPGTSEYVQGVEVPADYSGEVPEGMDVITLPAARYLMFRGEPFEEENYCEAIEAVKASMEKYDPSFLGYTRDRENPVIQLEPIGSRGYIEMYAVK